MAYGSFTDIEHCNILNESSMAIEVESDGEVMWFPRSRIRSGDNYAAGDEDQTIGFTDWILDQKGWS